MLASDNFGKKVPNKLSFTMLSDKRCLIIPCRRDYFDWNLWKLWGNVI
jgi:hypothetical protein